MRARRLSMLLLFVAAAIAVRYAGAPKDEPGGGVEAAFRGKESDVAVLVEGTVQRILSDDTEGARHQRFILELPSGHTVLVAHNIDLAPRVADLAVGASVTVHGRYEWNEHGGVIHWTHRDPDGDHEPGWIEYRGRRFD